MASTSRKIRVGVSGHDLKFWYPLQKALEATGRYEFREDVWTGHDTHDQASSQTLLEWADVLVAEWALANAVYYSRHKRPHQRLIVRLHLQERGTPYPADIDYSNVERVVFVGEHILRECVEKFAIPRDICMVLGNFVDVARYSLPKFGGAEYTLGIIGTAPSRKRLDLALDTLELLARHDDRYCLRVKGASPASIPWLWARTAEREYYQQVYSRINSGPLRHRVIFDPQGNDVHHWLQMVGSILSPSDFESFHMAVSEGAASGAIPVVWSWEGASEIYPEFPLVGSAEEAAALIDFGNRSAAGPRYREQVREVIRARYDSAVIMGQWDDLMSGSAVVPRQPKPASGRGVLVVWAIDNWRTFHRREMLEALAKNFGAQFDMLVIEPGNHYETIVKLGWSDNVEMQRIAGGELVAAAENIYRARLFTGGIDQGVSKAGYQGAVDPLKVLDGLIAQHFGDAADVVHWVYKPDQAQRLSGRKFVYEVYDDYTFDFGTGEPIPRMVEAEREILPKAEHVFFTSQPLMDRKGRLTTRASLVGNGVNYEPFARFRPKAGQARGRPVAGYLGNLSDFFDWNLMHEVCIALPDVDFVLHGQIEVDKLGEHQAVHAAMTRLPNVVFTGRVGRELGAAAVARYDVLLIPFVVNEAMHAVNPLKLWEYYATGRPVVTTPMDAIQEREPLAITAHGVDAWVAAIKRCLDGDAAAVEIAEARIARAEQHRWEEITRRHASVLPGVPGPVHDSPNRLTATPA
ncbi:glycosyltransferase [Lysobacter solisilvae (ex Woo and Kim 2020)]|uniref:Glycosyltransferase n=1 Tax=Agrilutibacter terrestris TaxID=2865112 RepID=A0A7H0FZG5_9GAMM|nr:glycosyltransferase [Lysobacter terrestris]QNP41431.1 glycosyltransferase [Lysobacter terrestris]